MDFGVWACDFGAKMELAIGMWYVCARSVACLDEVEMEKAARMGTHDCHLSRQVEYQGKSRKAGTAGLQQDFELAEAVDKGAVLGAELATAPVLDSGCVLRLLDEMAAAVLANGPHTAKEEVAVQSLAAA